MYLLIKHLLSSAWVPAPVLRAQNTAIAKSSTQRLGRRGQARAGSVPAHGCLSASRTLGLPGADGKPRGTGRGGAGQGSSPSLGKLQGRRVLGGPSQGASPGSRLPPAPLLIIASLAQSPAVGWAPSRGCHP